MSPWSLLALEGWLLGAGIVYLSVSSYDEVRDGAKEAAWSLYGVSLATFIGVLWLVREQKNPIEQVTLWMVQIILAALRGSWALLFLFAFVALVLGSLAWRSIPAGPGRARAKAAVRTSRFALALPALGVLIVTLALWSGLFVKTTKSNQTKERCYQSSLATTLFNNQIPKLLDLPADWGGLFLDESDAQGYLNSEPCRQGMPPNDYFQGVLVGVRHVRSR
jgi:hypothetical protein